MQVAWRGGKRIGRKNPRTRKRKKLVCVRVRACGPACVKDASVRENAPAICVCGCMLCCDVCGLRSGRSIETELHGGAVA